MVLKIYLIRHGETDFVKSGKIWGQKNAEPLNKIGRKQIEKLSKKLKKVKFDKIFVSDLERTIQTAEIISKSLNTNYIKDKRLREYNPGKISPNSEEWINEYKKILALGVSKYEIRPFWGENIWDVIKRANSFIGDLKKEKGNILIVSHSGFNSIFINLLLSHEKEEFKKIRQDSSCLNILELTEDKIIIEIINNTSHLMDQNE